MMRFDMFAFRALVSKHLNQVMYAGSRKNVPNTHAKTFCNVQNYEYEYDCLFSGQYVINNQMLILFRNIISVNCGFFFGGWKSPSEQSSKSLLTWWCRC